MNRTKARKALECELSSTVYVTTHDLPVFFVDCNISPLLYQDLLNLINKCLQYGLFIFVKSILLMRKVFISYTVWVDFSYALKQFLNNSFVKFDITNTTRRYFFRTLLGLYIFCNL